MRLSLYMVHFLKGVQGFEIKSEDSGEIFSSPVLTSCAGKLKIVDTAKLFNHYYTIKNLHPRDQTWLGLYHRP